MRHVEVLGARRVTGINTRWRVAWLAAAERTCALTADSSTKRPSERLHSSINPITPRVAFTFENHPRKNM